jgi:hypothetical protein
LVTFAPTIPSDSYPSRLTDGSQIMETSICHKRLPGWKKFLVSTDGKSRDSDFRRYDHWFGSEFAPHGMPPKRVFDAEKLYRQTAEEITISVRDLFEEQTSVCRHQGAMLRFAEHLFAFQSGSLRGESQREWA